MSVGTGLEQDTLCKPFTLIGFEFPREVALLLANTPSIRFSISSEYLNPNYFPATFMLRFGF